MGNKLSVVMWILCAICTIAFIGGAINSFLIDYQYEAQIGAYMDNARDCLTPECMYEQVATAENAMRASGLTEEDYGQYFFKKADNSMKFQYQHIDAILDRIKSVEQWKTEMYGSNATGVETMKDVYNEKMDNLRLYIHSENARSDWIAKDAWMLKKHFIWTMSVWILQTFLLIAAFVFGIIGGASWNND